MAANFDLTSELQTSPEKTNYARLCRLLIDGGTRALKELFDSIHPPNTLRNVLAQYNNKMCLNKLKPQIISQKEWNILYPDPMTGTVSSVNFDITLLTILLRNICNLQPPKTGWDNLPRPTDPSKEAAIARIKYYRNKICHGKNTNVSDIHFHGYWREIADALKRLGANKDDIDELKTSPMDSELERQYVDDLTSWKCKEEEAEDLVQTMLKMIDFREKDKIYCEKHKNDHLSMYCKTCVEPICSVCSQTRHSRHKLNDIDDAAKIWRDKVAGYISKVKETLDAAQTSLESAQTTSLQLKQDFEDKLEQIRYLTNGDPRQQELSEKLKQNYEKLKSDLDHETNNLKDSVIAYLHSKLIYFQQVSKEENNTKLLTECKSVIDHLARIYNVQARKKKGIPEFTNCKLQVTFDKHYDIVAELKESSGNLDLYIPALPQNSFLTRADEPFLPLRKFDTLFYKICLENFDRDAIYNTDGLEVTLTDSAGVVHKLEILEYLASEPEYVKCHQSLQHKLTHMVRFQVVKTGVHKLSVKLRKTNIQGSPCTENIMPYFHVEKVKYTGRNPWDQPSITVNSHGKVVIVHKVEFDNVLLHVLDKKLQNKERQVEISRHCIECSFKDVITSVDNTCLITGCNEHPVLEYDLDGNFIKVKAIGANMDGSYSLALNDKTNILYVTDKNGMIYVFTFCSITNQYNFSYFVDIKSFRGRPVLVRVNSIGDLLVIGNIKDKLSAITIRIMGVAQYEQKSIYFFEPFSHIHIFSVSVATDMHDNIYICSSDKSNTWKFTPSGDSYPILSDRYDQQYTHKGLAVTNSTPLRILVDDDEGVLHSYKEA